MTEGKKAKTKPVEDVDHAGDTSVLAERYDPRAVVVHHSLVVDQTNVLHTHTHTYAAAIVFLIEMEMQTYSVIRPLDVVYVEGFLFGAALS